MRKYITGLVAILMVSALVLAFISCDSGTSIRYRDREAPVENFDVIVVGAGISGWMAAVTLSDRMPTASIALLEADYFIGGSMNFAGGALNMGLFPAVLTAHDSSLPLSWGRARNTLSPGAGNYRHPEFPAANPLVPNWDKLSRIVAYSWRLRSEEFPRFNLPLNPAGSAFASPHTGSGTGGYYGARSMWRSLQQRLTPESDAPAMGIQTGIPRNITLRLNTRVLGFTGPVDRPTGVYAINTMRQGVPYFGTTGTRTNFTGDYIILATGGWANNNELGAYHLRLSAEGGWTGTGTWTPGEGQAVNVNQRDRALAMATMMDANWQRGRLPPFSFAEGVTMIIGAGGEAIPLWQAHNNANMYAESLAFCIQNVRFVPREFRRVFTTRNEPFGRNFRNNNLNLMPAFNPNVHILVNGDGLRFATEQLSDATRGLAVQMDATPPYYLIFDAGTAFMLESEMLGFVGDPQRREWPEVDVRDALDAWYATRHLHFGGPQLFRHDTLAGLAEQVFPGAAGAAARANFVATVQAYDQRVYRGVVHGDTGVDAASNVITINGIAVPGVGKADTQMTRRFDTGPFYAIAMYPGIHISPGGIRADWRGRIIAAGSPMENPNLILPNVRAVGELTQRDLLAGVYPGGGYIALAFMTGHIAALDIVSVRAGGSGVADLTTNDL